jgi:hypothetical protein
MWSARLAAVAALALGLLVSSSSGSTGSRSGLYGTVTKGPVRPVCRQGASCDAPVSVTLVFARFTSSSTAHTASLGVEWSSVRPDRQGHYRVALGPGIWTVKAKVKVGMSRLPKPHDIHVRAGHWDRIDLFFDTGIR